MKRTETWKQLTNNEKEETEGTKSWGPSKGQLTQVIGLMQCKIVQYKLQLKLYPRFDWDSLCLNPISVLFQSPIPFKIVLDRIPKFVSHIISLCGHVTWRKEKLTIKES